MAQPTDEDSFNPCFFGSGVLRPATGAVRFTPLGFNPCFFGSGVLSFIAELLIVFSLVFQSLFFWKWGFK